MHKQGLVRGTTIVGGITLLSRILGFVRDLLFARLFGAGMVADAFFVAFRIPNLLRSVMAEGALTSGFIPVFSQQLKKSKEAAQHAISSITGFLLVLTTLISITGIIFSSEITLLFAPGFADDPEKFRLSSLLLQIMFPYIIFVSIVAMLGGALNSVRIFGTAAMAQVAMNMVFIAGIFVAMLYPASASTIIAVSVLVGGLVQLIYQVPALKRAGFNLKPSFDLFNPTVKQVSLLMLPAIFGAAIYQVSIFLNTVFASFLREGSVSWLFYADRISQLPIGIFSIALASVLLPTLSHAETDQNRDLFSKNLYDSLRFTSFVIIPLALGIVVLAEPIVKVVYERGQFSPESTIQTANALRAYALGLWGASCHTMIVRAFIAKRDSVTPTIVGFIMLLTNFLLSLFLIGQITNYEHSIVGETLFMFQSFFAEKFGIANFGHVGLALASSFASLMGFLLLSILLHRKEVSLPWQDLGGRTLKIIAASSATSLIIHQLITSIELPPLVFVIVGLTCGALIYALLGLMLKIPEMKETFAITQRIYRRKN